MAFNDILTEEMLPGGAAIVRRYRVFQDELPQILAKLNIEAAEVTFADYANIVEGWLVGYPRFAKWNRTICRIATNYFGGLIGGLFKNRIRKNYC